MTVTKEAQTQGRTDPVEGELAAINGLNGTSLTAQEVYTFAVRLCDNQTDRDPGIFCSGGFGGAGGALCGQDGDFRPQLEQRGIRRRVSTARNWWKSRAW